MCARTRNKVPCKDHKGIEYEDEHEMCKAYNVNYETYKRRLKRGVTLEKALTSKATIKHSWNTTCEDHLGNKFTSVRKMCEFHKINYQTYARRIDMGMSVEEALRSTNKRIQDHKGNYYNTFEKMCESYNITRQTYSARIKAGWSLEKALTYNSEDDYVVHDHDGNFYKSESEMCRAYNIGRGTYRQRRKKGWSIRKALTYPTKGLSRKAKATEHEQEDIPYRQESESV